MIRDIQGYENYQITDDGRVWSKITNKWLKATDNGWGYLKVNLYKNGKMKCCRVHRLVANAFLPNPENLPQINHKDEDKTNNNVSNLEWCDRAYNINYRK